MIHDEIGLAQTVFCTGSLLQLFLELADPYSVNSVIGLAQSFPHCAREFSGFPSFPGFPGSTRTGGVTPHSSPSELSAHQMARPGHFRTQAYSQACDHGFQFSSMSGLPIIETHKSPPGSLLSDSLSLLAHIQSSSWPSSGS